MTSDAVVSGPRAILIGTMGAGKTTAGRLLAARLGVDFLDSDELVEERSGKTVQDIFVEDGEATFRGLERDAVAWALEHHAGVLSLGGGAVLDPTTRTLLEGRPVVFLRVGLADAVKRVGLGTGRPLLLGNVRSRVKQLLDERAPIYEGLARLTVETDGREPEEIADDIADELGTSLEESP
ncbi:shikimate kinase [Nocardioides caeni]